MAVSTRFKTRNLKTLLIIISALALVSVIGIYVGWRVVSQHPEKIIETLSQGADIALSDVHQTATRDGRTEWILDAASAQYRPEQNELLLDALNLTFFTQDNREIHLAADHGILHTGSNDIEVTGNVVIQNEYYRLKTEKMNYRHEQRFIFTHQAVDIQGQDSRMQADSMTFDLNSNHMVLEGRVNGDFGGVIAF
jgi:LPS export ABC transporter protein LptC